MPMTFGQSSRHQADTEDQRPGREQDAAERNKGYERARLFGPGRGRREEEAERHEDRRNDQEQARRPSEPLGEAGSIDVEHPEQGENDEDTSVGVARPPEVLPHRVVEIALFSS